MRAWKLSGACAVAALTTWFWLSLGSGAAPPEPPQAPAASPAAAPAGFAAMGAGSCAAQACHGGVTPMMIPGQNALRNEHTTWITRDKHTRAYQVLFNERSQSIAKNLGVPAAHEDARCLACHVAPTVPSVTSDQRAAIFQDGVSCESCHGAASGWISAHTTVGWDHPATDKRSYGMQPTENLIDRVQACVGCHVGAPADPARGHLLRDVNHDLIAAGHPRLNFEFGAYHANMPKHWREQGRNAAPDREARFWAVGQVASLKAALALLESRAGQAGQAAPWPEFTEYGCFSCHFDLKDKSWRSAESGVKDPEFGRPKWASWYVPMIRDLAAQSGGQAQGVLGVLDQIRDAMSAATPDPTAVARLARQGQEQLDGWLQALDGTDLDARRSRELIDAFRLSAEPGQTRDLQGWDHATQRYLALVALNQAMTAQDASLRDEALLSDLKAILQQLEFPKGYDSPHGFSPTGPDRSK